MKHIKRKLSILAAVIIVFTACLTVYGRYENRKSLPAFSLSINGSDILESIAVTKAPDKTSYNAGEDFDSTGMIVTATYTDQVQRVISNYTIPDGKSLPEGKTSVTITYEEKGKTVTTQQTITVPFNEFPITYDLDGGTLEKENPTSYNKTSFFTLSNPTRTGYQFTGWTGSCGDIPVESVTISAGSAGERHYKANWKANTYLITYNANGGQGGTVTTTHYYDTPATLQDCTFTFDGYEFLGWSTDPNSSTPEFGNMAEVKNLTSQNYGEIELFAIWKSVTPPITNP